jgi:hypothetical protein
VRLEDAYEEGQHRYGSAARSRFWLSHMLTPDGPCYTDLVPGEIFPAEPAKSDLRRPVKAATATIVRAGSDNASKAPVSPPGCRRKFHGLSFLWGCSLVAPMLQVFLPAVASWRVASEQGTSLFRSPAPSTQNCFLQTSTLQKIAPSSPPPVGACRAIFNPPLQPVDPDGMGCRLFVNLGRDIHPIKHPSWVILPVIRCEN